MSSHLITEKANILIITEWLLEISVCSSVFWLLYALINHWFGQTITVFFKEVFVKNSLDFQKKDYFSLWLRSKFSQNDSRLALKQTVPNTQKLNKYQVNKIVFVSMICMDAYLLYCYSHFPYLLCLPSKTVILPWLVRSSQTLSTPSPGPQWMSDDLIKKTSFVELDWSLRCPGGPQTQGDANRERNRQSRPLSPKKGMFRVGDWSGTAAPGDGFGRKRGGDEEGCGHSLCPVK